MRPILHFDINVIIFVITENQTKQSMKFWNPTYPVWWMMENISNGNANIILYRRTEVESCRLAEL